MHTHTGTICSLHKKYGFIRPDDKNYFAAEGARIYTCAEGAVWRTRAGKVVHVEPFVAQWTHGGDLAEAMGATSVSAFLGEWAYLKNGRVIRNFRTPKLGDIWFRIPAAVSSDRPLRIGDVVRFRCIAGTTAADSVWTARRAPPSPRAAWMRGLERGKWVGTLCWLDRRRNFGMLSSGAHGRVFVHGSGAHNFARIRVGDMVEFRVSLDGKRKYAYDVEGCDPDPLAT